jgi:hypothetical protein
LRQHARQFVRTYLVLLLCLCGGLALFNAVVDPYNVYPAVHLTALVPYKPNNDHRRAKAGLVRQRSGWDTLLMGSSYAVVGLDADHPALSGTRAFNLGLNGGKLAEQVGALRYAWRYGHPVRRVVLIFDNQWLLRVSPPTVDYLESPFNPGYSAIEYQGSNLLGTQSTEHAWHALRQWWRRLPATDNPSGRRVKPLFPQGTAQRAVFDDFLNTSEHLKPPQDIGPNLELFEQFARFCLKRGIALTVFIPPAHVTLLEQFDESGYWPAWEDGKRRLLKLTVRLNSAYPDAPPIVLWDFTAVGPYVTEPVPPADDTTTRLRWFWDPGHFRKELGDVMLQRALSPQPPPDGLGTQLRQDTIEAHLRSLRRSFDRYLQDHPRDP